MPIISGDSKPVTSAQTSNDEAKTDKESFASAVDQAGYKKPTSYNAYTQIYYASVPPLNVWKAKEDEALRLQSFTKEAEYFFFTNNNMSVVEIMVSFCESIGFRYTTPYRKVSHQIEKFSNQVEVTLSALDKSRAMCRVMEKELERRGDRLKELEEQLKNTVPKVVTTGTIEDQGRKFKLEESVN